MNLLNTKSKRTVFVSRFLFNIISRKKHIYELVTTQQNDENLSINNVDQHKCSIFHQHIIFTRYIKTDNN